MLPPFFYRVIQTFAVLCLPRHTTRLSWEMLPIILKQIWEFSNWSYNSEDKPTGGQRVYQREERKDEVYLPKGHD